MMGRGLEQLEVRISKGIAVKNFLFYCHTTLELSQIAILIAVVPGPRTIFSGALVLFSYLLSFVTHNPLKGK